MNVQPEQVTVFVVEDDDIDFMTIERSFKNMSIANPLRRAKNGKEALEQLQRQSIPHPFVMLLDLQMPKLNGLELLSEIRGDAKLANTIIFILTTSNDEKDILTSYQHNVAGYFVKDEAETDFLDIINLLDGYCHTVHFPGKAH